MHHDQQGSSKHPPAPAKSSKSHHQRRSSVKSPLPPNPPPHPTQRARAATLPSTRSDTGDWRKHKQPEPPTPLPPAKPYPSTVQISFPITISGLSNAPGIASIAEDRSEKEDHGRLVLPPPGIRGHAKLVLNVEALTNAQGNLLFNKEEPPKGHQRVDSAASVSSIHSTKTMGGHEDKRTHSNKGSVDMKPQVLGLEGMTLSEKNAKHPLYKTEMCRTWEETGHCRYGTKCQFAHGQSELRKLQRHPKYKTEVCRTFFERGECPYGKRCCFVHNYKKADGMERFIEHLNEQKKVHTATTSENTTPVLPSTPVTPAFHVTFQEGRDRQEEEDFWHVLTPPMQPVVSNKAIDTFDLTGPRMRTVSNAHRPPTREHGRTRTISDGFPPRNDDDRKRLPVFKNFS